MCSLLFTLSSQRRKFISVLPQLQFVRDASDLTRLYVSTCPSRVHLLFPPCTNPAGVYLSLPVVSLSSHCSCGDRHPVQKEASLQCSALRSAAHRDVAVLGDTCRSHLREHRGHAPYLHTPTPLPTPCVFSSAQARVHDTIKSNHVVAPLPPCPVPLPWVIDRWID